jgi:hypothetical protein
MKIRRSKSLVAVALATGLALAACGSDTKQSASTTAPSTGSSTAVTTASSTVTSTEASTANSTGSSTAGSTESSTATSGSTGSAVSLKGVCPDTVVLQTDWMPEAEHGFVYQLVGKGYTIDKDKAYVTGPLVDQNGGDTGVKVQIRSGGAAQQFASVSSIMYEQDDVLLGYVYTDEAIQNSVTKPTVAIESGFNKNPQMIMWDPAVYPDVTGIKDLGTKKVKIRYFGGAAYMDYFTSTGILSTDQVDGSYQGDPNLYITDEGKSAQQGFGSSEPYLYQNEYKSWLKPVKYQYINDVGWTNYGESIATKPANITKYADCFKALVPIIQHAAVDYINNPARTNAIILDAVKTFGGNFSWDYTAGTLDYGVKTIKADKLVANGPDGVMGKFDLTRVADLITKAIPVYTAQDSPPKAGLKPEDIVTNQFLDPSIGL